MANPKKRKSRSAARTIKSHQALKASTLNKCPECGKAKKPHMACNFCGYYRGRKVLEPAVGGKK